MGDDSESTDHWYCWKNDKADKSEAWVLCFFALLTVLVVCVCLAPQRLVQLTCMRSLRVDVWYRRFALTSYICAVVLSLCALAAHSLEVAIVASPSWLDLNTDLIDSYRCCSGRVCKNLRRVMIDLFAAIIPLWLLFKLSVTAVFVRRLVLSYRKSIYAVTRRESAVINGIFSLLSVGLLLLIYVSSRFIISDRLTSDNNDHYFYNDKNEEGWMIFLGFMVMDLIMTGIVMWIFNRRLFQILYNKTLKEDEQLVSELTNGMQQQQSDTPDGAGGKQLEDSYVQNFRRRLSADYNQSSELTFSGFDNSSQKDLIYHDRRTDFLERPDKSEERASEMVDFSVNRFATDARDSVIDKERYYKANNDSDEDDNSDGDEAGSPRKKSSMGIGLVIGNQGSSNKGGFTPTRPSSRMSVFSGAFGRGRRSSLSDIRLSQKQQKMLRIATQHSVLLTVVFFSFLLNELMVGWILLKRTDFDDRGSKNVTLIAISTLITVICLHLNSSSVIRLSNRFELSLIPSSFDGVSVNEVSPGHSLISRYDNRSCLSDFFLDCCHSVCMDSLECCACYCATDSMNSWNASNWCKYQRWCCACDKCFNVVCLFCVTKYIRNKIKREKNRQLRLLQRKRLTTQVPPNDPSNYQML